MKDYNCRILRTNFSPYNSIKKIDFEILNFYILHLLSYLDYTSFRNYVSVCAHQSVVYVNMMTELNNKIDV